MRALRSWVERSATGIRANWTTAAKARMAKSPKVTTRVSRARLKRDKRMAWSG
jgi:hypothetical protein